MGVIPRSTSLQDRKGRRLDQAARKAWATHFWNWTAERYSRQAIADEASYQKKLAITQKYLTPDMHVVEFGCGTGSTAIVHAPAVKTYHAIDVSEKMIEIARGKAAEAGISNLSFTVGTLEEANVPDSSCA